MTRTSTKIAEFILFDTNASVFWNSTLGRILIIHKYTPFSVMKNILFNLQLVLIKGKWKLTGWIVKENTNSSDVVHTISSNLEDVNFAIVGTSTPMMPVDKITSRVMAMIILNFYLSFNLITIITRSNWDNMNRVPTY